MTSGTDKTATRDAALHRGDSLATSVVAVIGLAGAQRAVGLVRNVLFCGWLEDAQLGRWSLAFNFLILAAPLVVLGIPGSFGRYVEHYRQRGALRAFLRRALTTSVATSLVAILGMWAAPGPVAWLVFGDADQAGLVRLLAVTLAAVLVFNTCVELLTALRLVRIVSVMQLISSCGFALLGVSLLYATDLGARAVIAAYGLGSLIAAVGGAYFVFRFWRSLPEREPPLARDELWRKVAPYAAWIWAGNLIANLFEAADQFMLKHLSGLSSTAADALVGQYYSSRVVPLLLVSLAGMLAGSLLPHLIRQWEQGDRRLVATRLNQAVKLLSIGFTACGGLVLVAAPLLFSWALRGKYDAGLGVLPGTLVYCIWYGMLCLAGLYLLCAENAKLGSLAVLVGLLVNIGLNGLLAPRFGLVGVVTATTIANAVALILVLGLSWRWGMRWDRGVAFATVLPLALCLGGWRALAVTGLACFVAWRRNWLVDERQRGELDQLLARPLQLLVAGLRASQAVS